MLMLQQLLQMIHFIYYRLFLGAAPSRNKYILDPSVQSGSAYGQTSNLYTPQAPNNTSFNPQSFGTQNFNQYVPQPFNQPAPTQPQASSLNPFTTFNNAPTATAAQPSILNPPPLNNFVPGVPPIEVAQPALQQRNPTPPCGWNDPPALKSTRKVSSE